MEDIDPRTEDDDEFTSEELEAEIMRADRPFGTTRFGTTPEEAVAGEGLDRALAQEVPEPVRADKELELVDEAAEDVEDQLVAEGVRENDPHAPPEEVAVTIQDDAAGATDHPDPHGDVEDLEAVEEYLEDNDV
jgi:hypothetical protein